MSPFNEHLLQRDIFENAASHIIAAFESEGVLDTFGGRTNYYFNSFERTAGGVKAPEGHIYIKVDVFRNCDDETDYILVPMDLLDEVYVLKIHERSVALAKQVKAEREAAEVAAREAERAKTEAADRAKLAELAAKYPDAVKS